MKVLSKDYDNGPSKEQMLEFAKRFTKEEWSKLCMNEIFMYLVDKDMDRCRIAAEMILAGKKITKVTDIKIKQKK